MQGSWSWTTSSCDRGESAVGWLAREPNAFFRRNGWNDFHPAGTTKNGSVQRAIQPMGRSVRSPTRDPPSFVRQVVVFDLVGIGLGGRFVAIARGQGVFGITVVCHMHA